MDISTLNECMYSSAPSKNCSESQGKNNPHCQNNTLGHIQLQQQTRVAGDRGGHFHDPYLAPPSAAGQLRFNVLAADPAGSQDQNQGCLQICGVLSFRWLKRIPGTLCPVVGKKTRDSLAGGWKKSPELSFLCLKRIPGTLFPVIEQITGTLFPEVEKNPRNSL